MKPAFTMIELIFVIIILGILASVAIPRMIATRDDANIAKSLNDIRRVVADFGSFYTATGAFDGNSTTTNPNNMTSVENLVANGTVVTYSTPDGSVGLEECVTFTLSDSNITVAQATPAGSGGVCMGVISSSVFADINKTIILGGSRANFY